MYYEKQARRKTLRIFPDYVQEFALKRLENLSFDCCRCQAEVSGYIGQGAFIMGMGSPKRMLSKGRIIFLISWLCVCVSADGS